MTKQTHTNAQGNKVTREFVNDSGDMSRYVFDFKICSSAKGWEQYDTDQDFEHFGVWIHHGERSIITYAEGDLTIVQCPTAESFRAELDQMNAFYGNAPAYMTTIDNDGNVTRYHQPRP